MFLDMAEAAETGYLLDNAGEATEGRFSSLETSYDGLTQAHLLARGIGPGWSCLEVGAGSGSVARWMAVQVGPQGRVLATDIDLRWAGGDLPNLRWARHDIAKDPLEQDAFDLVHARLVLNHLPERDLVLERLAGSLRPGGWIVVEDFDDWLPYTLDPLDDDELTVATVGRALQQALRDRGADPAYPRTLPRRLAAAGLVDIGASGHLTVYRGGSPESRLTAANLDQVGDSLVAGGLITPAERDTARRLLDDPFFVGNHPLLLTAWGRRAS